MCIKVWGALCWFISVFLNIPWKWDNLVSLRPNYFIYIGYLKTGGGGEGVRSTIIWRRSQWSESKFFDTAKITLKAFLFFLISAEDENHANNANNPACKELNWWVGRGPAHHFILNHQFYHIQVNLVIHTNMNETAFHSVNRSKKNFLPEW